MTAVLFDLDGTLLDTLTDLTASVNATMEAFGCPVLSRERVRALVGNGVRNLIANALPQDRQGDLEQALAFYRAHYDAHYQDHTGPYPGVAEALAAVAGLCPVGIVSNKPHGAVVGLARVHFPGVYALGQQEGIPHKPDPGMLRAALKELGCSRCVYIGDSEVDVLTAQNAGAQCVSVTWGFRDEAQLRQAGAKVLCGDARQLPRLVRELLEK